MAPLLSTILFLFNTAIGYLIGSLCSAIIVSKIFALPDPRTKGSQNPGATNVLRVAGKKFAFIVLLGDILKGVFAVALAKLLGANSITQSFVCLAVVMGHIYPIFFRFQGGKGVATAIGAFLALSFYMGVLVIITWLLVAHFTRYSSLASIISVFLAPFYSLFTISNIDILPALFFTAMFIIYKHGQNITRLIDKEEPKINFTQSLSGEIGSTLEVEMEPPRNKRMKAK